LDRSSNLILEKNEIAADSALNILSDDFLPV